MITYEKVKYLKDEILGEELLKNGRKSEKFFTRNRKIGFSDIIFLTLNKRGLSLKMEMSNFGDISGRIGNASESALCQQRQKIDPIAFKILNSHYIQNSYENEKDYEKFKGYILMAIDGTTIELPDVEELRKEYGVLKRKEGQRESAKALGSCLYDVVNNWIVDAQIEKINISERDLAKRHIIELVQLFSEMGLEKQLKKVIIIFDRGYPSIEMIYTLEKVGIKYLFRGKKDNFKKEQEEMKKKDEKIKIKLTSKRLEKIKDKKIRKELKEKETLESRFVKYKLKTGEEEILLTNISEKDFSTNEIGELYYKRWKIELAYDMAKNKLELQNFTGQNKIVVEQEFYGQMLMMNIAEDLKKDANKKVEKGKKYGYKYDYKVNMNILIGLMRKKFVLIMINMTINGDEKTKEEYDKMIEEISQNLIPIRPERKNPRNKYKGYNKYKQNYKRNS